MEIKQYLRGFAVIRIWTKLKKEFFAVDDYLKYKYGVARITMRFHIFMTEGVKSEVKKW